MPKSGRPTTSLVTMAWRAGGRADSVAEGFGDIFGDVFGDIFGGGRRGGGPQVFRGADLGYELKLDLEKAVAGDTVKLMCQRRLVVKPASGSGRKEGHRPGNLHDLWRCRPGPYAAGFFSVQQTCPACKGAEPRLATRATIVTVAGA